jgi:hypothetical protein
MSKDTTITISGKAYPVTLPDFATREDVAMAWHDAASKSDGPRLRRVAGAAIGLCTPVGRLAGASFDGSGLLLYGGKVYGWMRERGATIPAIVEAGGEVVSVCSDGLFAREAEVEARAGFSDPSGGDSIA